MLYASKEAGEIDASDDAETATGAAAAVRRLLAPRGDEPVDELGIPFRIHYFALATFAFSVAGVPLLFALTPEGVEIRQAVSYSVCGFGVALAPVIFYLGWSRNYEFRPWVFQFVLFYSILGPLLCQFVLDELRPAVMTLFMLGPIGAAFYFPLKRAMPLIVIGTLTILWSSTMIDEPDAVLRGMIVAVVTVSCSLMLSAMKRHLAETIKTNHELAERDALTGAHNMRKFDERIAEEVARSERGGSSCGFALIEFDLDQFKSVNDACNHSVGDNVLVATADAIQSVLTEADMLVRRGGDEFVVIAPDVPNRDVAELASLAGSRVMKARRTICPDLPSTVSIGWIMHEHGETAESTLRHADHALHNAKQLAHERLREAAALGDSPVAARRSAAPAGEIVQLHRTRVAASEFGENPMDGAMKIVWRTAGMSAVVLSLVVFFTAVLGHTSFDFKTTEIVLLMIWATVMAPLAFWGSTQPELPAWMIHAQSVSALALIALGVHAVGDAAPVGVEVFLMANVISVALLPPKSAFVYVSAGFILYGYFLYSTDYPITDIRLATTVVNFAILGLLLGISRQGTLEAASEKALLARTDPLTDLPNMRRLRDRLTYEIRRCETTGDSLALLMLDLDDFKSVNDKYGHSMGDDVLMEVAEALDQAARHADMPARRGGDEFAVVLTEAGPDAAEMAATRVAETVRRARLRTVADINPNASVGWVVWKRGESVDSLIRRADGALRQAKAAGRQERRSVPELA